MELAWNLCPYCGTPAPGMRRENMSMDDALRNLNGEVTEAEKETPLSTGQDAGADQV